MFDNVLNTTLFVLVTAVAVAAAGEIVQAAVELDRTAAAESAQAVARAASARSDEQALAQSAPVTLPTVTVTGHHLPQAGSAVPVAAARSTNVSAS
jgi:hypothetical protein